MRTSVIKPFIGLMVFIIIVSMACGPLPEPTATPVPPTNTPVPPTNTPVPTDTPVPTATPTEVPPPTEEPATAVPPPPQPEEPALPVNCYESDTVGYISCYDDTGSIVVDVPDYWTDVNGGEWDFDGEVIGVAISAAPNLDDFNAYYEAEGVFFGASDTFATWGGYIEFLDYYTSIYSSDCDLVGRYDYEDALYRGKYDQYENCGGRGGYDSYVLSAVDRVDQFAMIILVLIQTIPGDYYTVDQIWNTFIVLDM